MKKTFLLIVAIMFGHSLFGQIQMEQEFANDLIFIGNISAGAATNVLGALNGTPTDSPEAKLYCRIFKDTVSYGLWCETSNRFDDPVEFALGHTIEEAKISLESIIEYATTSDAGRSVQFTDVDGRLIQVNVQRGGNVIIKVLEDQGNTYAGYVTLTKANLKRALKLLDTKAEQKVAAELEKNKSNVQIEEY